MQALPKNIITAESKVQIVKKMLDRFKIFTTKKCLTPDVFISKHIGDRHQKGTWGGHGDGSYGPSPI
jgi:hypothetical protein